MTPAEARRKWLEAAMRATGCKHDGVLYDVHVKGHAFEPDYPALAALLDAPLRELEEAMPFFAEKWRWFLKDGETYHEAFLKDCAALAALPWREEPKTTERKCGAYPELGGCQKRIGHTGNHGAKP